MSRKTKIAALVLSLGMTAAHAGDKLPDLDLPSLLGGAVAAAVAALAWSRKWLRGWVSDGAAIDAVQLLREEVSRLAGVNTQLADEVARLHGQNLALQREIERLHRRFAEIDERRAPREPMTGAEALNEAAARG